MVIVLRYAFLLALGIASIFALVSAMAVTGQMLIVSNGYVVQDPAEMGIWVMTGMATLSLLSLCRFAFSGLPSMAMAWFRNNKDKLLTLFAAGAVCAFFLVF